MENNSNPTSNYKISYETLWKAVIRPPRDSYQREELGENKFEVNNKRYVRKDIDLLGYRNNILKCSLFEPIDQDRPSLIMPIIIYLHGNCSCRIEGIRHLNEILKKNINLFLYDMAGCGQSEGEYISLGYHEKNDLKIIVDFLYRYPGVGKIGIWGRSMGASTTILFSHLDKRISCICADSSFSNFCDLCIELAKKKIGLPVFLINFAMRILRQTLIKKNGLDITVLNPIESIKETNIPIYFIHAMKDDLINCEHTIKLFEACPSVNKYLYICDGNHNTPRLNSINAKICNFFAMYLCDGNFNNKLIDENEMNQLNNFNSKVD